MFLKTINIDDDTLVTEIVIQDYRTADVFRKYGINYCCGGRRPLQEVCKALGLDAGIVKKDLNEALRNVSVSNSLDFGNWDIDFLIDYICHVHHQYLILNLPETVDTLKRFAEGHALKYGYLPELLDCISDLKNEIISHIDHEEKIIFPYIRQMAHAYQSRETYSALLVRTLRKPIEHLMDHENEQVRDFLHRLRELTNNYILPPNACITHKVAFSKLKELDNDLVQHIHLENNILFSRAIALEKELLHRQD